METVSHKIAGVYSNHERARDAVAALREAGLDSELIDRENWSSVLSEESKDGQRVAGAVATGAGAGAGLGAVGAGTLAAAEVAIVAASPVLAALAAAGLGAIAGTAVAGVSSSRVREPLFRDLVREAVEEQGHVVVLVRADSEAQALEAQDVVSRTATERSIDQHGGLGP